VAVSFNAYFNRFFFFKYLVLAKAGRLRYILILWLPLLLLMHDFGLVVNEAVDLIHSSESKKKKVAELLSAHKKELTARIAPCRENFCAGGVDSGFVSKKLSFIDVVLLRCAGVVFDYSKGKVAKTTYLPGFFRFPVPFLIKNALEEDELRCSTSLIRLKEEVRLSKELIEKHKPDYFFVDGSVVPQYQDKPRAESLINEQYHSIVDEFESFYEVAIENDCVLIGAIEDSRGSRFKGILEERFVPKDFLNGLQDSAVLDYFLEQGERTVSFSYTQNISNHAILKDFDRKWSEQVHGMYLKPSVFDHPLRIEFLSPKNLLETRTEEVASVAFALSSLHREYAYPSVLIEADMRARLSPEEIDVVFNKISDRLSKNIKIRQRRGNRPFR
jgi:hypothetical protein